jgi:hypothetical protein
VSKNSGVSAFWQFSQWRWAPVVATIIEVVRPPQPEGYFSLNSMTESKRGSYAPTIVVSLTALFFLASVSAYGASGDKVEIKGMITSRAGETLIVKSAEGNVTVVLTDDTSTKDDKGLFGLNRQQMSNVVLMPGLKVDIDATSDDAGRFVARIITVDGDDLETAQMVEAGLHPTTEQVAANMQAIETNRGQLEAHKAELAAQKENIETHQHSITANKQQIEQNIKGYRGEHESLYGAERIRREGRSNRELQDR